ncbi:MAG: TnsD family Tn7-like transposition protein [Candidatus Zixiibacteriota bacterium]
MHPLRHLLLDLFIAIRSSGAGSPLPMETAQPSSRELDWGALDRQTAAAVRECAEKIRAARPPKRVSAAEIQRRLGKPGWITRRQRKLPVTVQALLAVCETVEQFQLRRVAWAVAELVERGFPVRAWRVRKLAGLGASESRSVEVALASIERGELDADDQTVGLRTGGP